MNWKEINEKYPKAFLEWIRVYMKDKYITSAVVENFTVRLGYEKFGFSYAHINRMNEEVYKLPFYFDTLGIQVLPSPAVFREIFNCAILITNQNGDFLRDKNEKMIEFPDRFAATIAGATKAFEILEAQLNKQEL